MNQRRGLWHSRWLPLVVLAIGLVIDLTVVSALRASTSQRADEQREAELDAVSAAIEFRMRTYAQGLAGVRAFVETDGSVDARRFSEYIDSQGLLADLPGLQALGWNRLVDRSDIGDYEQWVLEQHPFVPEEYAVRPLEGAPEMMIVELLEPVDGNEGAFGFDIASEERRATAIRLTRATGRPAATAPVDLVQDADSVPGILVLLETQDDGETTGVATAVFRTGDLLEAAQAEVGRPFVVHDIGGVGLPTTEAVLLTTPGPSADADAARELDILGRRWLISLTETESASSSTIGLLTGGATGAALAAVLALLVASTQRAARQADERAALLDEDVVAANAELAILGSRLERGIRAAEVLVWEHNVTADTTWSSASGDHPEAGLENEFEARLHPDDRERVLKHPEPGPGETREAEFRLADKHGNYRWILSRSVGVLRNDEWVVIGAHVDITDQRTRIGLVEQLVEDLRDRNEALRTFTHVASHDLRSPLRAVASLVSFLREDLPPAATEAAEPHLARIDERVDRMGKLIEDLLADARSHHDTEVGIVHLDTVVDDVVHTLDPPDHITLDLRLDPTPVRAVETALATCLRNLIGHAIKSGSASSLSIESFTRSRQLVITISGAEGSTPSERSDSTQRRRDDFWSSTSSLGMAIAQRTANAHGGTIEVERSGVADENLTLTWPIEVDTPLPSSVELLGAID